MKPTENPQIGCVRCPFNHSSKELYLCLPSFIPVCTIIEELCLHVFPPAIMCTAHQNTSTFPCRAILAMRNDRVATINPKVLQDILGTEQEYFSIGTAESGNNEEDRNMFPVVYLLSRNLALLPPSSLKLKVGPQVILLRNIYSKDGLCNGT